MRRCSQWVSYQLVWRYLLLCCLAFGASSYAEPWINPGDAELRHHLYVLADTGIIKTPVSTWPLMWSSIGSEIDAANSRGLSNAQSWSLAYVRFAKVRASSGTGQNNWRVELRNFAASTPPLFTDFSLSAREEQTTTLKADWIGNRFAAKLSASYVDEPSDGKKTRFDGSYLAAVLGNWSFSLGAIDRWWGPGWQNSLMLSTQCAASARHNGSTQLCGCLSKPLVEMDWTMAVDSVCR